MRAVSIVVPTKNRLATLRRAIESIKGQTIHDYEVIVVDDGDGRGAAQAREMFHEKGVVTINNNNRGQVAARNAGVRHATGEVIFFLDDDDWWEHNDYMQRASQILNHTHGAVFGSGKIVIEDELNNKTDSLRFEAKYNSRSILVDNTILVSGFAYHRSIVASIGNFDESLPFYWDWDWYIRLSKFGVAFDSLGDAGICVSSRLGTVSSAENRELRRKNLDRLSAKHGLGRLQLRNHESIARDQGAQAPAS